MSKKSNGTNNGKQSKGGKDAGKAVAVVQKAKKPEKVAGPRPESYCRSVKIAETLQPPQAVWDGYHGLMRAEETLVRSSEKSACDGSYSFTVYTIANAPVGSELADLSGSDIYLTNGQLHSKVFHSKFVEGSKLYKAQHRIWLFLRKFFTDLGIAQVIMPKQADEKPMYQKPAINASGSVTDFTAGVLGNYCFDKVGPRAVVALEDGVVAPQFAGRVKSSMKIKLVSVDVGHPLCGYVEPGAYIFLNQLSWGKIPSFTGPRAGECVKLWEFLTDIVAEHRKVPKKATLSLVAPQGSKPGDKVIVPREYLEVLQAA